MSRLSPPSASAAPTRTAGDGVLCAQPSALRLWVSHRTPGLQGSFRPTCHARETRLFQPLTLAPALSQALQLEPSPPELHAAWSQFIPNQRKSNLMWLGVGSPSSLGAAASSSRGKAPLLCLQTACSGRTPKAGGRRGGRLGPGQGALGVGPLSPQSCSSCQSGSQKPRQSHSRPKIPSGAHSPPAPAAPASPRICWFLGCSLRTRGGERERETATVGEAVGDPDLHSHCVWKAEAPPPHPCPPEGRCRSLPAHITDEETEAQRACSPSVYRDGIRA